MSEVISSVTAERATAGIAAPQVALTRDHEPAVRLLTLTEKDAEETEITVVALVNTIDVALAEAILQPVAVAREVKEKAKEMIGEPLVMTAGPDLLQPAVTRTSAQVLGTGTATVVVTGAALQTIADHAQTVPTVQTLNLEVLVAIEDQDPGTTIAVMVALRAEVAQLLSLQKTETLLARGTLRTAVV